MTSEGNNRKTVDLNLSFKPEKEQILSKVQKDIIEEELDNLAPIKENDINISTSYVFDNGDELEASIFVRNGLSNKINFDNVLFLLIDSEGKKIASKIFNLREIGDIPPKSARPWKIYFDKKEIEYMPDSLENCKVIFNQDIKLFSTVKVEFEDINENMNIDIQRKLNEYLNKLPILKKGQITINDYKAKVKENSIIVSIVVRNGMDQEIKVEKLPLTVYDSNNNIVFSKVLSIDNLTIGPLKAKSYNLIFEFDPQKYLEYDLTELHVKFKKE